MPTDALGRMVRLDGPARRIISLVPSLTEWLFSVGVGDRVVGVTDYCPLPVHPLETVCRVGGPKSPDHRRMAGLRPDLVVADQEENTAQDVAALTAVGVAVHVLAIRRVADVAPQLGDLAALLGVGAQAAAPLAQLRARVDEQEHGLGEGGLPTLALVWRDPWMVVGADTYAGDLLRLCGADNVGRRLRGRYPRASLDELARLAPELIILPSEPYPFTAADRAAFAGYQSLPAVRAGRVVLCDGTLLTWPGPRTLKALQSFAALVGCR